MNTYRRISAILLACALMAIFSAQAVAESMRVWVKQDGAKVYDAAGRALTALSAGTQLDCTGVKGKVCRVEADGKTGYMKKGDLTLRSPEAISAAPSEAESAVGKNMKAYVCTEDAKVYSARGKALGTVELNTEVTVTGVKNGICRVRAGGGVGYMRKADLSTRKTEAPAAQESAVRTAEIRVDSAAKPAAGTAKAMDWWESDIQSIFARGVTATITDVETGLAWREKRFGGTNHADVQPLTAADTAAMKQAYGGTWSWKRRAIFVTINGVNYAASMNGMPHGGGSISDNDFDGHHCIHFTNSRTHESNQVDPDHQAAIAKACAARLG